MMFCNFYFCSGVFVFMPSALVHPYVNALMKIFIFPNWSMHLLSFDEFKGGEKWVKIE